MDERVERARLSYEQAIFTGDSSGLAAADRDLDAVEADLALARGRALHGRFLTDNVTDEVELSHFERALHVYKTLGDVRGQAAALFWIGCYHQVVRRDNEAAVPLLEASRECALRAGDLVTLSEALRHLGIADHRAGRLAEARAALEESTRIRRELGLNRGIAANLIGLAYIAAGEGRRDDGIAILAEAATLAKADDAPRILRDIEEARAALSD
jgi:tetratricopeptide (TPR) repeat protein